MKKCALMLSLFICGTVFGQLNETGQLDIEGHKTISYLGASVSKPMFIGKEIEPLSYWQGLSLKSGLFFMQVQWGKTVDRNLDSSGYIGRGFMFNWGMRFSEP